MNRSVFWALVRKDIYLARGLIIIGVVAALVAFVLMGRGKVGFAIGGVLFLTTSMASGIFIAMLGILTDRVSQSRLFALSLPISGRQFDLAKLVSVFLTYAIVWSVLTALVFAAFLLPPADQVERGRLVSGLLIQGCILALFSVVVAWLFAVKSEVLSGISILIVNITFTLFMVKIGQPEVAKPWSTDTIVWTPFALGMLATEALVLFGSLAVAVLVISRRRDHV